MEQLLLVLGGRTFRPAEQTSLKHDHWMMQHVRAAGLDDVPANRTGKAVIAAVLERVLASGRTMHLLAGSLVEDGVPWSPSGAEENATFFGELTDPAEKNLVHSHLVEILARFFVSAGRPSSISEKSSGEKTTRHTDQTEDPPTMASGRRSSASSPATTRNATKPSPTGRSGKRSSRTSKR